MLGALLTYAGASECDLRRAAAQFACIGRNGVGSVSVSFSLIQFYYEYSNITNRKVFYKRRFSISLFETTLRRSQDILRFANRLNLPKSRLKQRKSRLISIFAHIFRSALPMPKQKSFNSLKSRLKPAKSRSKPYKSRLFFVIMQSVSKHVSSRDDVC